MIKFAVLLTILIACFQSTSAFVIKDCTKDADAVAKLGKVTISSCPTAEGDACLFHRGENASIVIDFTSVKQFSKASVSIHAKVGIIPVPFPVKPSDACGNYGFQCPVQPNQELQFKLELPLLKSYPAIKAGLTLQLLDQANHSIICIQLPVKIY